MLPLVKWLEHRVRMIVDEEHQDEDDGCREPGEGPWSGGFQATDLQATGGLKPAAPPAANERARRGSYDQQRDDRVVVRFQIAGDGHDADASGRHMEPAAR